MHNVRRCVVALLRTPPRYLFPTVFTLPSCQAGSAVVWQMSGGVEPRIGIGGTQGLVGHPRLQPRHRHGTVICTFDEVREMRPFTRQRLSSSLRTSSSPPSSSGECMRAHLTCTPPSSPPVILSPPCHPLSPLSSSPLPVILSPPCPPSPPRVIFSTPCPPSPPPRHPLSPLSSFPPPSYSLPPSPPRHPLSSLSSFPPPSSSLPPDLLPPPPRHPLSPLSSFSNPSSSPPPVLLPPRRISQSPSSHLPIALFASPNSPPSHLHAAARIVACHVSLQHRCVVAATQQSVRHIAASSPRQRLLVASPCERPIRLLAASLPPRHIANVATYAPRCLVSAIRLVASSSPSRHLAKVASALLPILTVSPPHSSPPRLPTLLSARPPCPVPFSPPCPPLLPLSCFLLSPLSWASLSPLSCPPLSPLSASLSPVLSPHLPPVPPVLPLPPRSHFPSPLLPSLPF
ncbi:unnamed protein product [Closterium sp. Yama58-4]|nr:unnamed protein product [Closterium sp. Yama58-4]